MCTGNDNCEVCGEEWKDANTPVVAAGCEGCGRMFLPCCNSEDPDYCCECYPDEKENHGRKI